MGRVKSEQPRKKEWSIREKAHRKGRKTMVQWSDSKAGDGAPVPPWGLSPLIPLDTHIPPRTFSTGRLHFPPTLIP